MRVGGHKAVRGSLIEDMELAHLTKQCGRIAATTVRRRCRKHANVSFVGRDVCGVEKKSGAAVSGCADSRTVEAVSDGVAVRAAITGIWLYLTVARTPVIWAVGIVVGLAGAGALRERCQSAFSCRGYATVPAGVAAVHLAADR